MRTGPGGNSVRIRQTEMFGGTVSGMIHLFELGPFKQKKDWVARLVRYKLFWQCATEGAAGKVVVSGILRRNGKVHSQVQKRYAHALYSAKNSTSQCGNTGAYWWCNPLDGIIKERSRPLFRCVIDRYSAGTSRRRGWSRARTGGKCTPPYNSLNELTPVIFATVGGKVKF